MADALKQGFNVFRRLFAQALGIVFVVVGIIAIPTPIINGLVFLVIGSILVAVYNPPLHRYVHIIAHRFPKLEGVFAKIEIYVERVFGPAPNGITIRSGFNTHDDAKTTVDPPANPS